MVIGEHVEHFPSASGDGEEVGVDDDAVAAGLRHEDALGESGEAERIGDAEVDAVVVSGAGFIAERLENGGRGGGVHREVYVLVIVMDEGDLPLVRERGEGVLGIGDAGGEVVGDVALVERILHAGSRAGDRDDGRGVVHRDDESGGGGGAAGIAHGEEHVVASRAGDGVGLERMRRGGSGAVAEVPGVSERGGIGVAGERAAELHGERAGAILPVHAGDGGGRTIAAGCITDAPHHSWLGAILHRAVVEAAGLRMRDEEGEGLAGREAARIGHLVLPVHGEGANPLAAVVRLAVNIAPL